MGRTSPNSCKRALHALLALQWSGSRRFEADDVAHLLTLGGVDGTALTEVIPIISATRKTMTKVFTVYT